MIKTNAVIKYKDKVLLLKRSKEDGGFWQTVTGTVEEGEKIADALIREVKEETGLLINFIKEPIRYFIWDNGTTVEVCYLCSAKSDKVKISFEHSAYSWLDIDTAIEKVEMIENKKLLRQVKDDLK